METYVSESAVWLILNVLPTFQLGLDRCGNVDIHILGCP